MNRRGSHHDKTEIAENLRRDVRAWDGAIVKYRGTVCVKRLSISIQKKSVVHKQYLQITLNYEYHYHGRYPVG